MPHSYYKIWIHAVWATKYRAPLIHRNFEKQLFDFIKDQFREIGCPSIAINGMPDHIHCLFILSPNKTIAEVIKQIKGSSSYYVNLHNLSSTKFAWQTGYAAFSVSAYSVEHVIRYIKNQKNHHQRSNYQVELKTFLLLNNIEDENEIVFK